MVPRNVTFWQPRLLVQVYFAGALNIWKNLCPLWKLKPVPLFVKNPDQNVDKLRRRQTKLSTRYKETPTNRNVNPETSTNQMLTNRNIDKPPFISPEFIVYVELNIAAPREVIQFHSFHLHQLIYVTTDVDITSRSNNIVASLCSMYFEEEYWSLNFLLKLRYYDFWCYIIFWISDTDYRFWYLLYLCVVAQLPFLNCTLNARQAACCCFTA